MTQDLLPLVPTAQGTEDPARHVPTARAPEVVCLRRLWIDTYQELVIYMPAACPICRAEGWAAESRILVELGNRQIIATLNVTSLDLLSHGEASLSEAAWHALEAREGAFVVLRPAPVVDSLADVRAKLHGRPLDDAACRRIVGDIAAGRYSSLQLAAFVAAGAGDRLSLDETIALTRAMLDAGERLHWEREPVMDKHCIGGLPGNRTTLIVVPIVAAAGLLIPKTSSRAITSPAGTADTMEAIAPVALNTAAMRRVVKRLGGCVVWGGAVTLSPVDDVIIRVERPLDLDSTGQLVASVLSKKVAAGATCVLVDIPVGPTAKARSPEAAEALGLRLKAVGDALGIDVETVLTDGSQPVGYGIGPALEARDVLAVLRRAPGAPQDLRERALGLAGRLLEMGGAASPGEGIAGATTLLDGGAALERFEAICEAQGGMREPVPGSLTCDMPAPQPGRVAAIDNRRLARLAKLAGAPRAMGAGLVVHVRLGQYVARHEPLCTLHAESPGELAYALAYADANPDIFDITEA
jgi:thymidine phosphorylase